MTGKTPLGVAHLKVTQKVPAITLEGKQHIWHCHSHTPRTFSDDAHIFQHSLQESVKGYSSLSIGINSNPLYTCA